MAARESSWGSLASLYRTLSIHGSEMQKAMVAHLMEDIGVTTGQMHDDTAWVQTFDGNDYLIAFDGSFTEVRA